MEVLKKLKTGRLYDPVILFLGIDPKEIKPVPQRAMCFPCLL
jgi:hypothetical protein